MKHKKEDRIHYQSIPTSTGKGEICLFIDVPGSFFGKDEYAAFVGGYGVGHAETLKQAKSILLLRARDRLKDEIHEAQLKAQHYQRQLEQLTKLKRQHPKPQKI